jgi:hypothetical protein
MDRPRVVAVPCLVFKSFGFVLSNENCLHLIAYLLRYLLFIQEMHFTFCWMYVDINRTRLDLEANHNDKACATDFQQKGPTSGI